MFCSKKYSDPNIENCRGLFYFYKSIQKHVTAPPICDTRIWIFFFMVKFIFDQSFVCDFFIQVFRKLEKIKYI